MFLRSIVDMPTAECEQAYKDTYNSIQLLYMIIYVIKTYVEIEAGEDITMKYQKVKYLENA